MSEQDLWLEIRKLQTEVQELKTKDLPHYGQVCIVRHNANVTVSSSSNWQNIAFNTDVLDPLGMHDPATNNNRITVPVTGIYAAMCGVEFSANAVGTRGLGILVDNTTFWGITNPIPYAYGVRLLTTTIMSVLAGHYVSCQYLQDSGSALTAYSYLYYSLVFGVMRIA